MKEDIGGKRLGSGATMEVDMKEYQRSNHDLGFKFRSSMSAGTLVPFMSKVMLPGDTWDINLGALVLTHPSVGPLYGNYKLQLDVFQVPVRLYNSWLHNNKIDIGRKMSTVQLPKYSVTMSPVDYVGNTSDIENSQVGTSCILKYLGFSGIGRLQSDGAGGPFGRLLNAVPLLGYWDIFKNYYANKQEDQNIAYVIHTPVLGGPLDVNVFTIDGTAIPTPGNNTLVVQLRNGQNILLQVDGNIPQEQVGSIKIRFETDTIQATHPLDAYFRITNRTYDSGSDETTFTGYVSRVPGNNGFINTYGYLTSSIPNYNGPIQLSEFSLDDIETIRDYMLTQPGNTSVIINQNSGTLGQLLFGLDDFGNISDGRLKGSQEGLIVKTYQSDLFNNWVNTDWIDGDDGVNELSRVDTSEGFFNIDQLNIANKVYNLLNRIAISGGTYNDWLNTVYTADRVTNAEIPIYEGGMSDTVAFDEIFSTAENGAQPLGTIAGKGRTQGNRKGGNIVIKAKEVSYAIGIVSLTPRLDYSQGNEWDIFLTTMDDFHKPEMDAIGFQDLLQRRMHWAASYALEGASGWTEPAVGKQPAWIEYMTSVNKVFGSFAEENNEMFMVLNRRYELNEPYNGGIKDMTTYIDPAKYNYMFAQTALDSQNFWVQIKVDINTRRKISSKIIPNL